MITFISDLDKTLIYSQSNRVDAVCVEKIEDREITYMTPKAIQYLKMLFQNEDFQFIPCTARSYEQTMRISFLREKQPAIMICDMGASIYYYGEKDTEWEQTLLEKRILCLQKMIDFQSKIMKSQYFSTCRKIVSNNNYFLVFCFQDQKTAVSFYYFLQQDFKEKGIKFSISGRKVYCCPIKLDKALAVFYLQKTKKLDFTVTAGDSLFDLNFNKLGDVSLLPGHADFMTKNSVVTKRDDMEGGENILYALSRLDGRKEKETIKKQLIKLTKEGER